MVVGAGAGSAGAGAGAGSEVVGAGCDVVGAGSEVVVVVVGVGVEDGEVDVLVEVLPELEVPPPEPSCIHQPPLSLIQWYPEEQDPVDVVEPPDDVVPPEVLVVPLLLQEQEP